MHAMRLPAWFMNRTRLLVRLLCLIRKCGTVLGPESRRRQGGHNSVLKASCNSVPQPRPGAAPGAAKVVPSQFMTWDTEADSAPAVRGAVAEARYDMPTGGRRERRSRVLQIRSWR